MMRDVDRRELARVIAVAHLGRRQIANHWLGPTSPNVAFKLQSASAPWARY
jgi:hypothetical protein